MGLGRKFGDAYILQRYCLALLRGFFVSGEVFKGGELCERVFRILTNIFGFFVIIWKYLGIFRHAVIGFGLRVVESIVVHKMVDLSEWDFSTHSKRIVSSLVNYVLTPNWSEE